jgi:hypothetical protein
MHLLRFRATSRSGVRARWPHGAVLRLQIIFKEPVHSWMVGVEPQDLEKMLPSLGEPALLG